MWRPRFRYFLFQSVLPRLGHEVLYHMNLAEKAWPTVSALSLKHQYNGKVEVINCGPDGYDERSNLIEERAKHSHPAVFRGYVSQRTGAWDADRLKKEIGAIEVPVRVGDYDEAAGGPQSVKMPASTFIDYLIGAREFPAKNRLAAGKGPYVADEAFPMMDRHLPLPKFFAVKPTTTYWLGAHSITPLHCHPNCDVLLTQLIGKRRVMLVPPHQAPLIGMVPRSISVCTGSYDPFEPDAKRYPGTGAIHNLYCELEPGDTLLIPGFWFHAVRLEGLSLAASQFNNAAMPLSVGGGPNTAWRSRPFKEGWN